MSDTEATTDKLRASLQTESKISDSDLMGKLESSSRLPDKMMRILLSNEAPEAIWWLPKGESFAIQKDKFEGDILLKYFRGNKFKSLVRNLHRWGFRRMTCDGDASFKTVAFSHPEFRQDSPELVAKIEMTNEIKGKKPVTKIAAEKRKAAEGKASAAKVARTAKVKKALQSSYRSPAGSPRLDSQPQQSSKLQDAMDQTAYTQPTIQGLVRNAEMQRLRESAMLASLQASRGAHMSSRLDTSSIRSALSGGWRESSQEKRLLQLLGAPSQLTPLPRQTLTNRALIQREISTSIQNPLVRAGLNPAVPAWSALGAGLAPAEPAQSQAALRSLLHSQHLNDSILQGHAASPGGILNLIYSSNGGLGPDKAS